MVNEQDLDIYIGLSVQAAREAGEAILDFYCRAYWIYSKADGSPITEADIASNQIIKDKLVNTGFPIVSEENSDLMIEEENYWLIDPLDGTKDFLAKNDEFTINISLILDNKPALGVIFAPALDELYSGRVGSTPLRIIKGRQTSRPPKKNSELKIAVSRFHDSEESQQFAKDNSISHKVPIGAALKYGRIAFGEIDVYPRFVGTSEWDTAAGQAIIEASSGQFIDLVTNQSLRYGKSMRRNPPFIAIGHPHTLNSFERRAARGHNDTK